MGEVGALAVFGENGDNYEGDSKPLAMGIGMLAPWTIFENYRFEFVNILII